MNNPWIMTEHLSKWAERTPARAMAVHRDRYVKSTEEVSGETLDTSEETGNEHELPFDSTDD